MDFIGQDPDARVLFFLTPVQANKMDLFHQSTTPSIHQRLDSRVEMKFLDCLDP